MILDGDSHDDSDILSSQTNHLDLHDYCSKDLEHERKLQSEVTESAAAEKNVDEETKISGKLKGTKRKSGDEPEEADEEFFKKFLIKHPKKKLKAECADCGYTCTGKYLLRRHVYKSK